MPLIANRYGHTLSLADNGNPTNEMLSVGGRSFDISRSFDSVGRLISFAATDYAGLNAAYSSSGNIAVLSNSDMVVTYAHDSVDMDIGFSLTLANGRRFVRTLTRPYYLNDEITAVVNASGSATNRYGYTYDALHRPTARNADRFAYNRRGEVASATVAGESSAYAYDGIGNFTTVTGGAVTNTFSANELNQYEEIASGGTTVEPTYTSNGELASFGPWTYACDALSRLTAAYSNGTLVVSNRYDHLGRRIQKIAPDGTHTFLYDGWRPVVETVAKSGGGTDRIEYYWGKDLSGSLDGAAGVGGLLYVKRNGAIYVPFGDAFGNVMGYWDEQGNVVAEFVYDAFGRTVAKSGTMADVFTIRYSSKYYDTETGMYYYGKRYYVVALCRWLTRDPIEEQGGVNLYGFCGNQSISSFDLVGLQECEINAFFKQPKMPFQIGQYVNVVGTEITHRNVMGDFFSWIPAQRKELDRYVWTVNFIPRFSPPNENGRGPSSDQGRNALGGFVRAYRPEVGAGDLGFSVWGDPVVLGEEWSVAGVLLKRRTDYPNKKFRFGYFVYVAQSESAPFVLTDYNDDMFSVWNGGISKLPDADRYATGKRGHCEIVEVQYGDVGNLMGRIRFPKRKGAK